MILIRDRSLQLLCGTLLLTAGVARAQIGVEAQEIKLGASSALPYERVTFSAKLRSNGSQPLRGVRWGIFSSSDPNITSGDSLVASGSLDLTTPFVSRTVNGDFEISPTWTPGTRYVGLFVDYTNAFNESNEDDNIKTTSVTIQTFPDLLVEQVSMTGDVAGEAIQVKLRVRNRGNATAGDPFNLPQAGVFLGATATPVIGDFFLGGASTRLSPGAHRDITVDARIPAHLEGQHHVHVVADYGGIVRELTETNNRVSRSLVMRSILPAARIVEWQPKLGSMALSHGSAQALAASGGEADMTVAAPSFAEGLYLCLWSSTPTFAFDATTSLSLALLNSQLMARWFGTLDARGIAFPYQSLPSLPGARFVVYTHVLLLAKGKTNAELVPEPIVLTVR